jgi:hypothetical protein
VLYQNPNSRSSQSTNVSCRGVMTIDSAQAAQYNTM